MSKSLLGRWVQEGGRIMTIWVTGGARVQGRWSGAKGGIAGLYGRLENGGKLIRGHWWDEDAGLKERDNAAITITLGEDGQSLSASASQKGSGSADFIAHRPAFKRKNGKIVDYGFVDKAVFSRLTDDSTSKHKLWAEEQRTAVLATSIKEASDFHGLDGAITYIPPLAVGDVFDDSAVRKHSEHSRHKGKQVLTGANIAGRATINAKVPPFEWQPAPYMDLSTVNATLRKMKRERTAKLVPAALLARKPFRPTNDTTAVHKSGDEVYISTYVDATLSDDVMKKLASESIRHPPEAAPGGHLARGPDGKLQVVHGPKNLVAGYPHWTKAAEAATEHMPDEYDARKKVEHAEFVAQLAKRKGRPAFHPVGPSIERKKEEEGPEEVAVPVVIKSATGAGSPAKDKSERPPYNPYTHYDAAGGSSFPEHISEPMADGAYERLKASGKLGKAAPAVPGEEKRPHFTSMSPSKSGRMATSVQLHPLNLSKATQSAGHTAAL